MRSFPLNLSSRNFHENMHDPPPLFRTQAASMFLWSGRRWGKKTAAVVFVSCSTIKTNLIRHVAVTKTKKTLRHKEPPILTPHFNSTVICTPGPPDACSLQISARTQVQNPRFSTPSGVYKSAVYVHVSLQPKHNDELRCCYRRCLWGRGGGG